MDTRFFVGYHGADTPERAVVALAVEHKPGTSASDWKAETMPNDYEGPACLVYDCGDEPRPFMGDMATNIAASYKLAAVVRVTRAT